MVGFGLGAFLDGIVLHQILQWHHLVVSFRSDDDLAGLESNTFWDGVFRLASWLIVVLGLTGLIRRRDALSPVGLRAFTGHLLIGWGAFNIVDQVVFHLLLKAHHIRMVENYQLYDWGYTLLGALLIAAARLSCAPGSQTVPPAGERPRRGRAQHTKQVRAVRAVNVPLPATLPAAPRAREPCRLGADMVVRWLPDLVLHATSFVVAGRARMSVH